MKTCNIEGCNDRHHAKGFCSIHYRRFKTYGDPLVTLYNKNHNGTCSVERCNGKYKANELCQEHFSQSPEGKLSKKKARLKKYGLTPKEYDKMVETQDNRCVICGNNETIKLHGKVQELAVDHVKDSNPIIVRGLLCIKCNSGIGLFNHDVSILQNAIKYLKQHSIPKDQGEYFENTLKKYS